MPKGEFATTPQDREAIRQAVARLREYEEALIDGIVIGGDRSTVSPEDRPIYRESLFFLRLCTRIERRCRRWCKEAAHA